MRVIKDLLTLAVVIFTASLSVAFLFESNRAYFSIPDALCGLYDPVFEKERVQILRAAGRAKYATEMGRPECSMYMHTLDKLNDAATSLDHRLRKLAIEKACELLPLPQIKSPSVDLAWNLYFLANKLQSAHKYNEALQYLNAAAYTAIDCGEPGQAVLPQLLYGESFLLRSQPRDRNAERELTQDDVHSVQKLISDVLKPPQHNVKVVRSAAELCTDLLVEAPAQVSLPEAEEQLGLITPIDLRSAALCEGAVGTCYLMRGDLKLAADKLSAALTVLENQKHSSILEQVQCAQLLRSLSRCSPQPGLWQRAQTILDKAVATSKTASDTRLVLSNYAQTFLEYELSGQQSSQEFDTPLFEKRLQKLHYFSDPTIARAYLALEAQHKQKGELKEAAWYLKRCFAYLAAQQELTEPEQKMLEYCRSEARGAGLRLDG